jgi:hypothetical protein
MRPVFKDALVGRLRLPQMLAPIVRDAREQDVMMTPFDDVNRVDLDIAEMLDRGARCLGASAEWRN